MYPRLCIKCMHSKSAKLLDAIEIGSHIDIYIYLFAEVSI